MSITSALGRALFGLMFFCLLFAFVERVLGRARGPWLRRGCWTDAAYWFFTIAVIKPMNRLALMLPVAFLVWLGCASVADFRNNAYQGFGPLAAQPLALQAIEVYLLADFIAYWTHRLFHRGKWWPFHAVHHSSEHLDWLAAHREHPLDSIYTQTLINLPPFVLGFPIETLAGLVAFRGLWAIYIHSNVRLPIGPLRWFIGAPELHHWHHDRDQHAGNYANISPLMDLLFGTYVCPDHEPRALGLQEPMPKGYIRQLIAPLTPSAWWRGRGARGSSGAKPEEVRELDAR